MRNSKVCALLAVLGLTVGGAGAVAGAESSASSTTDPPASGSFEDSEEWQQLVEAAQDEGELVIVSSVGNATSQSAIWQRFGETFDIEIVESTGSTSDVNARVLTERSQGLYTVDIATCGTSCQTGFIDGGALTPLEPLLVHPDIQDRSLWRVEEFPWLPSDTGGDYVSEYILRIEPNIFLAFYNTETVTQDDLDELQSWWDFIENPRWHGRIVTENPVTDDGTGSELARGWITFDGPEFFDRLYREAKPEVMGIGLEREMVDGLARGQWDISFLAPGASSPSASAIEQGLPIAQLTKTLEEGPWTDLTGHFGVFDQAANPAAAKLFVNWILSHEGQTAVNELLDPESSLGQLALRNDVEQGNIADDTWNAVTAEGFEVVLQDDAVLVESTAAAQEFLGELFRELGYEAG